MHTYGAENYKNLVQVRLRETVVLDEQHTIIIFGKRRSVPRLELPSVIRRRFAA